MGSILSTTNLNQWKALHKLSHRFRNQPHISKLWLTGMANLKKSALICSRDNMYSLFGTHLTSPLYAKLKEISLDMFKGQYVLLVWYPLDFTFVCPTEILDFSDKAKLFEDEKCQVIFASVDSQFAHKEFALKDRKKGGLNPMNVPMMSDLSHKISKSYGCYLDSGNDEGVTLRATYIIDGNGILRHLSMNDLPVG